MKEYTISFLYVTINENSLTLVQYNIMRSENDK